LNPHYLFAVGLSASHTSLYIYSVTVLCGELLREAEFLVNQRVHPMTIMQGWRQAVQIARAALEQVRPLYF
jgi:chaperonin GroEL (HSP60 family)